MSTSLALDIIRRDGGTQVRASLDVDHVEALADHVRAGGMFADAVVVFYDGTHYWLADGFHRVTACERAGVPNVAADVRTGTQRDAQLFACGANAQHTGLRRTNADKRRAVEMLLRDAEWAKWSDRKIATLAGVGNKLVSDMRPDCVPNTVTERRGADGRTINTANIGRSPKTPVASELDESDDFDPDAAPGEEVVADGITPPPPVRPEPETRADFGELDDGMAYTRLSAACRDAERNIMAALDARGLSVYRGKYREAAEVELLRIVKLLSERVKAARERPTFGVINGGR